MRAFTIYRKIAETNDPAIALQAIEDARLGRFEVRVLNGDGSEVIYPAKREPGREIADGAERRQA